MARRRRFCDGAGFTQHCWECVHAKEWTKVTQYAIDGGYVAKCDVHDYYVVKYDSPNNPSSIAGGCGCYDDEWESKREAQAIAREMNALAMI